MKRFIAFAGNVYYPSGGMQDCIGSYDNPNEAIRECKTFCEVAWGDSVEEMSWWHVWDSENMEVWQGHRSYFNSDAGLPFEVATAP